MIHKGQSARNGIRRFKIILFVITAVIGGNLYGQNPQFENKRIGKILTTGNVSVGRQAILAHVRAREGQLYNIDTVEEDIKRIATIEGVEYAYYNVKLENDLVILTYVVVEKNLVRSIAFIGNKHFDNLRLAKELGFKKGDYLDVFIANSAVESMEKLYRKKGYPFVNITLDDSKIILGQVEYTIDEGSRCKVSSISFAGNKTLSSKELKKAVKTKTRKFFLWPDFYNQDTIDQDLEKLTSIYQEKAFLDAKIEVQTAYSKDRGYVDVTFAIDEGSIYLVEELSITGNQFFSQEELREAIKLKKGWYYSNQRGKFDVKTIKSKYHQEGFVDVMVEHKRTFVGTDKVNVEFNITEGRRFKTGRIDVVGNEEVQDRVVRRIMDEEGFKTGRWYNADIASGNGSGRLEKLLKRSIYANSVEIIPGDINDDGTRNADVQVIEGQTGSIMFGAGVASDNGVIGQIVYDQRNFDIADWPENLSDLIWGDSFKGAGQRFRAAINPGTVQSTFSVSFTEPYLYDKPVSLETAVSGFERRRDGYDIDRVKGYVGLEKRYEDRWRRGLAFRAERVKVSDIDDDAPSDIWDVEGYSELFGAKLFIRKDTTDNRYLPSSGYHFNAAYEQVGGDYTFGVVSATQRWYYTLYEDLVERKTVLETKLHGSSIVGGKAPLFEKFYGGGTGSIRGFDYRGVSPRSDEPGVDDDPIGSDWIITGNAEISVPLNSEVLSALFFVDTGLIEEGGVRASVGTGIQIMLPQWFGPVPMRFELAAPFMKEDEDETRTFSFTVGALF